MAGERIKKLCILILYMAGVNSSLIGANLHNTYMAANAFDIAPQIIVV